MEYEYSLHALDQSIQRRISTSEFEEAIEAGEAIELPVGQVRPELPDIRMDGGWAAAAHPMHSARSKSGQGDNPIPAGTRSVDRFPNEDTAMKCDVCGVGERREELIRYHIELDGKLVVVEHVPALVCHRCGEISIAPNVASSVQRTVWEGKPPLRAIEGPVYEFGA